MGDPGGIAGRLGSVLYWTALVLSFGWLALVGVIIAPNFDPANPFHEIGLALAVLIIPALGLVAFGWALRYVLSGKKSLKQ